MIEGTNQEQRTRLDSYEEDVQAQNGGSLCAPPAVGTTRTVVVEGPRQRVQIMALDFAASSVSKTCTYTLTAPQTPDGETGWKLQFRDGTGAVFGSYLTKAPWTRTKDLPAGMRTFTATWTKSGQTTQLGVLSITSECR